MVKINNSLKLAIVFLILLPCVMLFSACGNDKVYLTNITKTASNGVVDTYTMEYSNGTTKTFNVTNGADGKDLTMDQIYQSAVSHGFEGDYFEFLNQYLKMENVDKNATNIHKAMLSAVSVYAQFPIVTVQPKYAYDIFNGVHQVGTEIIKDTSLSAGSGVIYSLDKAQGDAYILTNYHVVYNVQSNTANKIGDKISIYLYGATPNIAVNKNAGGNAILDENGFPTLNYSEGAITGEYVGGSMNYDVALIKVSNCEQLKSSNARAVDIAQSYAVGQTAVAVGNPEAEGISATSGIVSVDSEYIKMQGVDNQSIVNLRVMRIDTAINGGNSGGGIFNSSGEMIGLVNAKVVKQNIENMAYATPINLIAKLVDNLITNQALHNIQKYEVGLSLETKNSRAVICEGNALTKVVEDVCVLAVKENSVAFDAGFQVGDIIKKITIDKKEYQIDRMYDVIDNSLLYKEGNHIYYYIERNGVAQILDFVVETSKFKTII